MGYKSRKHKNTTSHALLKTPSLKYIELENAFESSIEKFCGRISDSHRIYPPSDWGKLEVNKESLNE